VNAVQDERDELLFCHYANENPSNKVKFFQTVMEKISDRCIAVEHYNI
jgi:hypothetical protein